MTLRELDRRMYSDEYTRWQAYYRLRPFGEKALDLRLAYMLANVAMMAGGKAVNVEDFDPFPDPKGCVPMSDEDMHNNALAMKGMFKSLTRRMGGEVKPWPQAQ